MKVFIIILAASILLMFVLRSFTAAAAGKTEEQKYRVVKEYKGFEIRFYPSATLATISSDANSYKELSGPGFRKLAGYIFGGYASDGDLKTWSEKLHGLLKENGITPFSNYRFLGYNPPYQFAGRRNEIIVTVDWKDNAR